MHFASLRSLFVAAIAATVCTTSLAQAQASAYSDDVYVVTNVRTVEASTRAQALELCQRDVPGGVSVGVDWGNGVHLCQTRASVNNPPRDLNVLQRIGVFTSASCPYGMGLLHEPRRGVLVCVSYAIYPETALAHRDFISDVSVTGQRNYNNDAPGWTTLPYSLHTQATAPTPSHKGVFLSYRQPVRPVTALQVLTNVGVDQVASACADGLGDNWRVSGDTSFLDQATSANKTVLCVQRDATSASVLSDIALVTGSSCSADFQTTLPLTGSLSLCGKWVAAATATASASSPFVADLELHRVNKALGESTDATVAEFLPGKFQLVANVNLNTASSPPVYLFQRKWQQPRASVSPPAVATKAPLMAKLNAATSSLSFKILQLADLHFTGDPAYACRDAPAGMAKCTEAVMTKWLNELLDVEKPDFVAFTGDNVETFTAARRALAMDAVTQGVEARGIPYGMVFGNHDDENGFPREEIVKIATSKTHSYTQRGPVSVDGVGNYELGVQAPSDGPWGPKGTDVFRMYFLDSHGYPDKSKYPLVSGAYDWVKPSQIAYYRTLSETHASAENSVPSVMFFHIPLLEYAANAASKTKGQQNEAVSSSEVNTNLFSALVDRGEVKATFVGHDHVNEFCYKREGIQLCYGGGAGFGRSYGSQTFARRARVIEWTVEATGKRSIRSWKRHFGELSSRKNEEVLYSE